MSQPFKLYNTLTRSLETFVPLNPGEIKLYVCGMTVYDHCHVGHARAMVVFDTFVRYLRHRGWQVKFVRNFTDVDDKIINRANEQGIAPEDLAAQFVEAFREDANSLRLIEPDEEPRVSECIPQIQTMIQALIDQGHAYAVSGSVWFSVETHDEYGKLSRQKVSELRSPDEVAGKKSPADFALWKAAKPNEPSWESPWGPGRPGWHIECSVMAKDCLGAHIDIHGGGLDLVFPHHENEIAQSECANRRPYANYWMHNGLLTMNTGQKMGKSLGNVINVRNALSQYPAEALRLYYLQNHYRSPLPWGPEALPEALGMLARLYNARETAESMQGDGDPELLARDFGSVGKEVLQLGQDLTNKFYASMDDDFNTARALGHVFELARAINRLGNHKKARRRAGPIVYPALKALQTIGPSLGLLLSETIEFQQEVKIKRISTLGLTVAEVDTRLQERQQARQTKDWHQADIIRAELEKQGVIIMDKPEGVEWRVQLVSPEIN